MLKVDVYRQGALHSAIQEESNPNTTPWHKETTAKHAVLRNSNHAFVIANQETVARGVEGGTSEQGQRTKLSRHSPWQFPTAYSCTALQETAMLLRFLSVFQF